MSYFCSTLGFHSKTSDRHLLIESVNLLKVSMRDQIIHDFRRVPAIHLQARQDERILLLQIDKFMVGWAVPNSEIKIPILPRSVGGQNHHSFLVGKGGNLAKRGRRTNEHFGVAHFVQIIVDIPRADDDQLRWID